MGKFIFIIGGARSGKSSYAVARAKKLDKKVVYIATAAVLDEEMKKRIKLHKASRPRSWKLIEEDSRLDLALLKLKGKYGVALIDCLGLLISNLLGDNLTDKEINSRMRKLVSAITKIKAKLTVILVSNEVGSGIVPANTLARRFRDLAGLANQLIAKKADEVIFLQAGIPMTIKGE